MNTEFKGTKGDWRVQEQFDAPTLVKDHEDNSEWYALSSYIFGNDKIIGETRYRTNISTGYDTVNVLTEMRANAQLIAAAPDLLEALQYLVKRIEDTGDWYYDTSDAELAINKALGNQ